MTQAKIDRVHWKEFRKLLGLPEPGKPRNVREVPVAARNALSSAEFGAKLVDARKRLLGYALTLTRNRDDAEDLISETVCKAWRARLQFEVGTNFMGWIVRILKNEHISRCRLRTRQPVAQITQEHWGAIPDLVGANGEAVAMHTQLLAAIAKLPWHQRDIAFSVLLEELGYEEVAKRYRVSIGTVRSALWRARRKLVATLAGHELEDPDETPAHV